jgi:hypothetical protein
MGKPNSGLIREMRASGFVTIEEAARRVRRSKWTMYYWARHMLSVGNVKRSGKSWFVMLSAVKLLAGGRP